MNVIVVVVATIDVADGAADVLLLLLLSFTAYTIVAIVVVDRNDVLSSLIVCVIAAAIFLYCICRGNVTYLFMCVCVHV